MALPDEFFEDLLGLVGRASGRIGLAQQSKRSWSPLRDLCRFLQRGNGSFERQSGHAGHTEPPEHLGGIWIQGQSFLAAFNRLIVAAPTPVNKCQSEMDKTPMGIQTNRSFQF